MTSGLLKNVSFRHFHACVGIKVFCTLWLGVIAEPTSEGAAFRIVIEILVVGVVSIFLIFCEFLIGGFFCDAVFFPAGR